MRPPGSAGDFPEESREARKTLALLGALCFFLSAIEYLIPKPLPFMRLGLANMPLLLALRILGPKDFVLLAILKVLGQGLVGGTFLSFIFLFSIAGTFSSAFVMYLLNRLFGRHVGFVGVGCAGAMVSNGVQLLLARRLVFGDAALYLAPPFLAAGFVVGIGLGFVCEYFAARSAWFAYRSKSAVLKTPVELGEPEWNAPNPKTPKRKPESPLKRRWENLFNADELFVAGLLMALIFLHDRALPGHLAQFLFFCILVMLSGKRNNFVATAVFVSSIVFFSLLVPHGKILFSLGPLQVTKGSLFSGIERALTLSGLMMLSRVFVRGDLRLPGNLGSLLGQSMRVLEMMREKKAMIAKGRVISGIDRMIFEIEAAQTGDSDSGPRKETRRSVKGIALLAAMIAFTAALAFWR